MLRLGVNIDHVATVRQARRAQEPDPVAAAVLAILGGADGITVHLREDRRHIQDRDVRILREVVTNRLNLEMAAVDQIVELACQLRPDEATLVPERRQELTTEGGLDVHAHEERLVGIRNRLQTAGIQVSLFIDPDKKQVEAAHRVGVNAIEFHTGNYADARGERAVERELKKLTDATQHALKLGLHVHMGHGLNYTNVCPIAAIAGVEELNIGHSIVSRAVLVGMERAVREMKEILLRAAK
jgi:pyridoxine 5-phosphate synthase